MPTEVEKLAENRAATGKKICSPTGAAIGVGAGDGGHVVCQCRRSAFQGAKSATIAPWKALLRVVSPLTRWVTRQITLVPLSTGLSCDIHMTN